MVPLKALATDLCAALGDERDVLFKFSLAAREMGLVNAWDVTPEAPFRDVRPGKATRETRLAAPLRALGAKGLCPALDLVMVEA